MSSNDSARFSVLDGWRGVSILLVLADHLLPLGPKSWQLNAAAGYFGMSIFFTLSGFLITHFLLHHDSVGDFLIRRFFRIIPLAWVGMIVGLLLMSASKEVYLPHFLFYANYVELAQGVSALVGPTGPYWSLCVEVQFYVGVAVLVLLFRKKGLYVLPALCLFVTLHHMYLGSQANIKMTHVRGDEILAGCTLALIYNNRLSVWLRDGLSKINPLVPLVVLVVATLPQTGVLNYLKPYAAMMLVGSTLLRKDGHMQDALKWQWLAYVATVSYALYVIHPILEYTWLGEGEKIVKYMKRPLLFLALFVLAHVSTFYFEQKFIAFGKMLSKMITRKEKFA